MILTIISAESANVAKMFIENYKILFSFEFFLAVS